MNFCPECGSKVQPEAKFCVGCGQPLTPVAAPRPQLRIPGGFAAVFAGLMVVGLVLVFVLFHRYRVTQVKERQAQTQTPSNLPPGHPQVQLPAKAREFIASVEAKAKKQPKDIAIWNRLGTVALRASMFDSSYFRMASEAYGHVLQLDPENLVALRGIGNLDYDQQKYDEAIAAYEHYLKHKPDDPDVQTDLGTMYLYTGNPDQAIVRYKKAISIKHDAFEAYFNLGVAYAATNKNDLAHQNFDLALQYAPDKDAKARVKEMIAKLEGKGGETQVASSSNPMAGGEAPGGGASDGSAPAPAAKTFEGQIEAMLRGLPFAGPKVQSVKWPSKSKAIVLMNNFPMDEMPPFARQKFLSDVSAGIAQAKETFHVTGPFELQIADAASGQVMDTVSK